MKLTEKDKKALRDGLTIQFHGTVAEFKKFSVLCDEYIESGACDGPVTDEMVKKFKRGQFFYI
jgi:NAD+--asparagine ADP-ribosyltransferase